MKKRLLLDCTIRDGGYINQWEFGQEHARGIYSGLLAAGVDFLELGFLDTKAEERAGHTRFPEIASIGRLFSVSGTADVLGAEEAKDQSGVQHSCLLAMVDLGAQDPTALSIPPRDAAAPDGLRVMFKKEQRREAMRVCEALKEKGYLALLQPVSVTDYTEEELQNLITLSNAARPDALFIVDTYGLLQHRELMRYVDLLDDRLRPEIALGYHGHNNFQMAYANGMTFLARDTERDLIVDGSLYGMGKSAGNAPTELLTMHMQQEYGRAFRIEEILEAIEAHILPLYQTPGWGYGLDYFLAAYHGCHPNYVHHYREQGKSAREIHGLLKRLSPQRRLRFEEAEARRAQEEGR